MDGNGSNLPLHEPKFNAYANADLCVVVKYKILSCDCRAIHILPRCCLTPPIFSYVCSNFVC